jgi:hypothetical protein
MKKGNVTKNTVKNKEAFQKDIEFGVENFLNMMSPITKKEASLLYNDYNSKTKRSQETLDNLFSQ